MILKTKSLQSKTSLIIKASFIMLYSHIIHMQLYTYTCRIHFDAVIKTSEDVFKKYTSHFIRKVVCKRELETEQRLQHIDLPSPSGHRRVSFSFSWAAQPRDWGPSLSGTCSHSSVFSPTGLVSKLNRGSRGPLLLGGGFLYHILSLTHLISNSLTFCAHRVI